MVNAATISLVKYYEGLRTSAYLDAVGVPTIGYGHTEGVKIGQKVTAAKAEALLQADLAKFEAGVKQLVKVPLTDNQLGALVAFAFNLGLGNLGSSMLLKLLNAGQYDQVPAQFARWNKAGGKVLKGLTDRRAAEAKLFLTP